MITDIITKHFFNEIINKTVLSFYYGSSIYGINTELSDKDIFCVVSDGFYYFDELPGKMWNYHDDDNNIDYLFTDEKSFKEMCKKLHIIALESVFLTEEFIIQGDITPYRTIVSKSFDKWKIRKTISSICSNSWSKAHKKMTIEKDYDIYKAKKSLFHSLRLYDFGKQLAENNMIVNYHSCNALWDEIYNDESTDWEHYKKKYQPLRNKMRSDLVALCPAPKEPLSPISWIARYGDSKQELSKKFSQLHSELVNRIILFCKENNIENADNIYLSTGVLKPSVDFGEWIPYTDSCFYITDKDDNTLVASM